MAKVGLTDREIDERVMYGDPQKTGPVIKSGQKDKTIHIIYNGIKLSNFVNDAHISQHDPTIENIVDSLNHFFNEYPNMCYENKIVEAATEMNNLIYNELTASAVRKDETDIDNISSIAVSILDKFLVDRDFIMDIKRYVDKYSYYEESMFKHAVENYEESLDIDGVKIACMLTVLVKMFFIILKKCVNSSRIYRKSINLSFLETKIYIAIFEKLHHECSYVYSNMESHLGGNKYDFFGNFMNYFFNKSDKIVDENEDHIMKKHALLGTTESSIYTTVYDEFIKLLYRQRLNFMYRPDLIKGVKSVFVEKYAAANGYNVNSDDIIYFGDRAFFGFNISSFIKYRTDSLKNHVSNASISKKENVIVTISAVSTGDGLSRKDKVLRREDIINPNKFRINGSIKEELMTEVRDNIKQNILTMIKEHKVVKNIYNNTILPMYLEYLNIRVGNPISYMNTNEFYEFLAYTHTWSLLRKFGNGILCDMLLANKTDIPVSLNTVAILKYIDDKFGDYTGKHHIEDKVISICNTKWSAPTYLQPIVLEPEIFIDFLFEIYDIKRRSIDERV